MDRDEDSAYEQWRDENPEEWGQMYDRLVGPQSDGTYRSNHFSDRASGAMPDEARPVA